MSFFLYSNILCLDLQNGQIFMFTGMLKVLPNDDSLATILGHEMSHAILQHAVSNNRGFFSGINVLGINLCCKYFCQDYCQLLASDLYSVCHKHPKFNTHHHFTAASRTVVGVKTFVDIQVLDSS